MRLVVVAEDRQSEMFLRRVLYGLGFSVRDLTFRTAPKAAQSADRWVLQMHGVEAKKLRANAHAQPNTGIVTCIDADHHAVVERHAQLDAAMDVCREPGELMAWLVPKQNIETWLRALGGQPADEATDYKRRGHEPVTCDATATAFLAVACGDATTLPSIRVARAEIERVRP
ncbi:MAG: hypothetical protein K8J09_03955 [Planctomycetes bacterium]|nr:hypothetical protein [Planctomycetota bacterium]MCC7397783.1 hypothetical protein [Planctomycetota bacterium]